VRVTSDGCRQALKRLKPQRGCTPRANSAYRKLMHSNASSAFSVFRSPGTRQFVFH
jgi:hypothetical protein